MQLKVVLDNGAQLPTKAHDVDAGYDIYSPEIRYIKAGQSEVIDTGVHIQIPKGYVGMLKSKSGLNVKHGLVSEGVIDAGYNGSIAVKLYNHSFSDYYIQKGDKITQLVIMPIADTELVIASSLEDTERGNNGFGSTGR